MPLRCRKLWADYFDGQNVKYAFFSAANAAALQEARREAAAAQAPAQKQNDAPESVPMPPDAADEPSSVGEEPQGEDSEEDSDDGEEVPEDSLEEYSEDESDDSEGGAFLPIEEGPEAQDPRTKVLSVLELEDLFVRSAPDLSSMPTPFLPSICLLT